MALEDEFNVEITDKDAEEIFTPRQAVEKVWLSLVPNVPDVLGPT